MGAIIFEGNFMVSGQFSGGGDSFARGQLSRGQFSSGAIGRGAIFRRQLSRDNYPVGNFPQWQFSGHRMRFSVSAKL